MKLPAHAWPDTDLGRGALFFFQIIQEQIAADTFESFRVMTLDSIARLEEALDVARKVQSKKISNAALEPVYAEVSWSLKKDPVAEGLSAPEISVVNENLKDKRLGISDHILNISHLLEKLRRQYKSTLEQEIIKTFSRPGERLRLRQLAGFYCSHLLNRGYSKAYLQRVLETEIFNEPIQRVRPQLLTRFFDYFDGQVRKMHVITPVAANTAELLDRLGFTIAANSDSLRFPSAIEYYRDTDSSYLVMAVEAFDEEGAVQKVEGKLGSLRAIALIGPKASRFSWTSERFVVRNKANKGCSIRVSSLSLGKPASELQVGGRTLKALKSFSRNMMSTFNVESSERIISSINTCALARNTPDREVQLISVWSAIEVLLSEPDPSEARIVHYVRHLTPCVCARYAKRQMIAVHEQLLLQYKKGYRNIVRNERELEGENDYIRFAGLLTLESNAGVRQELMQLLSGNPLALNRVAKLNRDFSSADNMQKSLKSHFDRVEWQLHRIYRARNDLVHAGRSPSFLEALILNAFEYYTTAVRTIVSFARRNDHSGTIDQSVAGIGIEYEIYMKMLAELRRKQQLEAVDVKKLFTV